MIIPKFNSNGTIEWLGPCRCDGDGENGTTNGVACYAPLGVPSLDYLANAGRPGDWWALVCDSHGTPLRQTTSDPAPGAYISTTSYHHPGIDRRSPLAWLAAGSVPFAVVTSKIIRSVKPIVMGCKFSLEDTDSHQIVWGIVGDVGPDLGEYSIAVCKSLGLPYSPKNGGSDDHRFKCTIYPGQTMPGFRLQPS